MKSQFRLLTILTVLVFSLAPSPLLRAGEKANTKLKHVYVFSSSHLDMFFTGAPPYSYSRDYRMFDAALDLAQKQKNFRYVIESLDLLSKYLKTHPERRAAIAAALRDGQMELAGQWCLMLQNVATEEDLVRNILLAHDLAMRDFGVKPLMQSLSDLPGQTPQAPQILSESGLKGVIITRGGPRDAQLFNWKGLDGSTIHAAWLPFGYAGGYLMGLNGSLATMEGKKLEQFEMSDISSEIMGGTIKQVGGLAQVARWLYHNPPDPALIEVAWDNMMPPANLASNIDAWNTRHGDDLRLIPMLPGQFFSSHFPDDVPVKTGSIPSVWGNGGWTLFGGYPQIIRTSFLLLRAEKWASLADLLVGTPYPAKELRAAWEDHLVTLDHEGFDLTAQRDLSEELAEHVLEDSCLAISSHVAIPHKMDIALVVFNDLNWPRSATITKEVDLVGDPFAFFTQPYHKLQLVDASGRPVPFEIVSKKSTIIRTVKIRFRANDVPPLGWKTYYLRPAEKDESKSFPQAVAVTGDTSIEEDPYRVQFDTQSGSFLLTAMKSGETVRLRYYQQPQKVSSKPGFFRLKDFGSPAVVSWKKVERGDDLGGSYLDATGEVQGARLRVKVQLNAGSPISVSETVDWPGGKVIKLVRDVEFPKDGKFVYGVPFGTEPFANVMAESGPDEKGSMDEVSRKHWYQNREINGWVAWRSDARQITVASEARGGEFLGHAFKVTLLTSGGEKKLPDVTFHPVPDEFTTRMLVSFGPQNDSPAKLGWEFYNPLKTMISVDYLSGTLPAVFSGAEGGNGIILTAFKRAEDGRGWIARGYATEEGGTWPTLLPQREWTLHRVNLMEAPSQHSKEESHLHPFHIRSVRMVEAGK